MGTRRLSLNPAEIIWPRNNWLSNASSKSYDRRRLLLGLEFWKANAPIVNAVVFALGCCDGRDRTIYNRVSLIYSFGFIRCLSFPDGLNVNIRRAGIGVGCPVLGLRPIRDPLSRTTKVPNEAICTSSPRSRQVVISARTCSTIAVAFARDKRRSRRTASTRSARVTVRRCIPLETGALDQTVIKVIANSRRQAARYDKRPCHHRASSKRLNRRGVLALNPHRLSGSLIPIARVETGLSRRALALIFARSLLAGAGWCVFSFGCWLAVQSRLPMAKGRLFSADFAASDQLYVPSSSWIWRIYRPLAAGWDAVGRLQALPSEPRRLDPTNVFGCDGLQDRLLIFHVVDNTVAAFTASPARRAGKCSTTWTRSGSIS